VWTIRRVDVRQVDGRAEMSYCKQSSCLLSVLSTQPSSCTISANSISTTRHSANSMNQLYSW